MGTLHYHDFTYWTTRNNNLVFRILFTFNSCYVTLTEGIFNYIVICKYMSTTVRVNGSVCFLHSHESEHYHYHRLL